MLQNETAKINFVADEMRGFYALWVDSLMFPAESRAAMNDFENSDIKAFEKAIPQTGSITWGAISQVESLITERNISSVEALKHLLTEKFDPNDSKNIGDAFDKAFPAYHDFFEKNNANIRANLSVLETEQKGYANELNAIYAGFGIDKQKRCTCYLNPFPGRTTGDGRSNPRGDTSVMNYSVVRLEADDNYLNGANILQRKASTPLHETTHSLFYASELKSRLEDNPQEGMQKTMDILTRYFDADGNEKKDIRASSKDNAVAAINEAFAVCATGLYNEKRTGKPVKDADQWYHGFEAANRLAPVMYPLFKHYLEQGKMFDDRFFQQLADGMDYFKDKTRHNEINDKISRLKEKIAERRTFSVPPTGKNDFQAKASDKNGQMTPAADTPAQKKLRDLMSKRKGYC